MAKTARKRKSKQEQVSEELKLRIICLFFIFLVIIAAMQLGVIGDHLNYVFMYEDILLLRRISLNLMVLRR